MAQAAADLALWAPPEGRGARETVTLPVGAPVEFICAPGPLKNGTEAAAAHVPAVEATLHTALLNRGCLIAPFHNMMLISPATKKRQIDRLITAFDSILTELFA